MSWYNFTSTISKPPGIFLEWTDVISVSEWASEWVSYVFNRKRTAVIGISADFKGGNSGEGGHWGCNNQGDFSVREGGLKM